MSIKDRQLKNVSDKVLQRVLQSGRFPDLVEIQSQVNALFTNRAAGLPRFVHIPISESSISDKDHYNQSFQSIKNDLEVSFQEMGHYIDEMMSISHLYETEKRSVILSLKRLEHRVDRVLDRMKRPSSLDILVDSFENFNSIDFDGNEQKGIAPTTAWVNLEDGQVTLHNVYTGGTKYDLSFAEHTVTVTKANASSTNEEVLPLINALKDTVNEAWQHKITSPTNEPVEVEIFMELPQVLNSNIFSIDLHSPKETTGTLFLSEDNKDWKELSTLSSHHKLEWLFQYKPKYIKVVLQKKESDFTNGTSFEFLFGAINFSLRKEVYTQKETLMSTPYPIDQFTVDKITLKADQVIFPKTKIDYYIGFEDDEEYIDWHQVEPNQMFDMQQLSKKEENLSSLTAKYGTLKHENFGMSFYSAGELEEKPLSKRTHLYAGHHMWKLETKSTQENQFSVDYVPTLKDWNEIKNTTVRYVPTQATGIDGAFTLQPESIQKLTIYVYCEESLDAYSVPLNVGNARIQMYVNHIFIKPISSSGLYKYNYHFNQGWNKIELLTYTKEASPVQTSLDLNHIGSRVVADKNPLKEVDIYHLLHNTSRKDIGYYAIEGKEIIVNYNPYFLDAMQQGVRYLVEYEYIPVDAKQMTNLRFMAVLSRQNEQDQMTPILKNYKLILE